MSTVIRWLSLLCWMPLVVQAAPPANAHSPLGINLSGVVDYSTEMPFVDVFCASRPWISQQQGQPWGKGPPLELDEHGWVRRLLAGQYATTLMVVHGGHPAGRYVCLYDGDGDLDFQNNAKVVNSTAGRIELEVTSKESLFLHLRRTNPDKPVRNIRVLMPGCEKTSVAEPFSSSFLRRTGEFGVIRFMDWMKTNDSPIREWSERPLPADATQAARGVSVEYMVDLCNRLHADPWFCMPHLASDDFVRHFATLVREHLDPSLRVYVEHSNEVWNGQFQQARYAQEQGRKLKLSDNAYQAQLFYHSRRSVQIFKIWEEVFGGRDRLVRVLGSQSANPWVSEQVLAFEEAHRHADAIAIAPYFGHSLGRLETADEVAAMPLNQIFDRCREEIRANRDRIASVVQAASRHGLKVISYEGGQHLVGFQGAENHEPLMKTLHAANRDPRMKQLYLEDMASWKEAGGGLFTVFSSVTRPSKWGSWGMLEAESQDPATAPKYQAVLEFIRTNPRWW